MAFASHLTVDASYMPKLVSMSGASSKSLLAIVVAAVLLLAFLVQWAARQHRMRQWPVFNKCGWFSRSKATNAWRWNARQLLFDGFAKSPKGFMMDTDMHRFMVLSPQYANEIRSDSRLNFLMNNSKEFLGHLPGFEVFKYNGQHAGIVVNMVRSKLTQALGLVTQDISDEMTDVLHEQWNEDAEWHAVPIKATILEIVARLSSRVFLGPELCRNKDWLRITIDYTVNIFMAAAAVKRYPKFMHRIVHWILPETRKIRAQSLEARRIIQPVIDQRLREMALAKAQIKEEGNEATDPSRKYADAVQWMEDAAMGKPYDAAVIQLGLSLAAIHTTTDMLSQVLYDICPQPDLIKDLREEIVAVLQKEGWKRTALYKLKLMDSVLKETQRLKPPGMVSMQRYATDDVSLKDGLFIPKGSSIGVSAHWSWDSSVYPEPEKYDGYRFLKLAQNPETEKIAPFVSTSPQHLAFGHGKHACPGRFFAANEIKIALAHILLKYDLKLAENAPQPTVLSLGWMMQSDSQTQLLVRRRREEISIP